jgi:hypothetical protein
MSEVQTRGSSRKTFDFEIDDGWFLSDLETDLDRVEALNIVEINLIKIKEQIARYDAGLLEGTADWRYRIESAAQYKRIVRDRIKLMISEKSGRRDLTVRMERLKEKLVAVRKLCESAPDETLRGQIALVVEKLPDV